MRDQLRLIDTSHRQNDETPPLPYLSDLRDELNRQAWPLGPWPQGTRERFISNLLLNLRLCITTLMNNRQNWDGNEDVDPDLQDSGLRHNAATHIRAFPWPYVYPLGDVRLLLPRLAAIRQAVLDVGRLGRGVTPLIVGQMGHGSPEEENL